MTTRWCRCSSTCKLSWCSCPSRLCLLCWSTAPSWSVKCARTRCHLWATRCPTCWLRCLVFSSSPCWRPLSSSSWPT
ncbi:hypothetical protein PF010_g24371 [Phytophthora fragariae]|uniref:Secreted protein n=1 Tax=Phytophthora fragariae TaxID=53985 RepID=A0A6G0K3Q6_9STRA|nr:hypothetical protein PF010_g24371 [Phytophthora fragariae]